MFQEPPGLAKKTINEIIKAKASIAPESALKFERVFRQPAEYWLNLENLYREALAREEEHTCLESEIAWLDKPPIAKVAKLGWVRRYADKAAQLDELLSFFWYRSGLPVGRHMEAPDCFLPKIGSGCSPSRDHSAWLRRGEIEA